MAVAFDAANSGNGGPATSVSFSLAAGTPSAVGVGVSLYNNTISAVTYDGVSMGAAFSSDAGVAGDKEITAIYGKANPPAGTKTVSVTPGSSAYFTVGAVSVTGSDTTTCFRSGSNASAHGTSNNPSNAVSSATNDLVMDVIGTVHSGVFTKGASQTQRWQAGSFGQVGAGSTQAGAASVTMAWSINSSMNWTWCGASFQVAAAGGGLTITTATLPAGLGALGSGQTKAILPAGLGAMG